MKANLEFPNTIWLEIPTLVSVESSSKPIGRNGESGGSFVDTWGQSNSFYILREAIFSKENTLKTQYSEQARQTLFVHYIQ